VINKDQLKAQKIKQARVLVFACPSIEFTEDEIMAIDAYVEAGGNVLILAGEGGDKSSRANLNSLLSRYSMELANNSVVRTSYYRYFHPKEALVTNGVMHDDFLRAVQNEGEREQTPKYAIDINIDDKDESEGVNLTGFKFLYAYGTSLNLSSPAVPLLNSGTVCYPVSSTLFGYCQKGRGRLFVGGSWKMFSDQYIDQEENTKLFEFIINFALKTESDSKSEFFKPEKNLNFDTMNTNKTVPNIEAIAEKLKSCIQETPDISHNFLSKFESNLFEANFDHLPESLKLYDKLNIPYGPLKLIPPIFETPMLGLTPSIFPPILIDLEPPKLELFDLDDEFANQEFDNKSKTGSFDQQMHE
jgi:intraflagellar transport protein 52